MKKYAVKSMFLTLQGEGHWTGRRAVFLRFAGCNLWSGREQDRAKGPGSCASWCDTDFVGGERMTVVEIAARAADLWGPTRSHRFIVLTGGEPTLQMDYSLTKTLQNYEFYVAVETNGTREIPGEVDWITCSPKAGTTVVLPRCDELKLVYPQADMTPEVAPALFRSGHGKLYLQPMDGPDREANVRATVDYCLAHPEWRLSLQSHKILGIP